MSTRQFLVMVGAAGAAFAGYGASTGPMAGAGTVGVPATEPDEDVFAYIDRTSGGSDPRLYRQVIGAANDFKEGDQAVGVAATAEATRANARALLANTRIGDLYYRPLLVDDLQRLIWHTTDAAQCARILALLNHPHLLGSTPAPPPLHGGDHLHLLGRVSHTHGHTPNPYRSWRPCPVNSGAASS